MNGKNNNTGFAALRAELKREREKNKQLSARLQALDSDEKLWELIKDNTRVKNRIIDEYLKSLASKQRVSLISSTGFTALTPVNKPKNLADAKRLADKIIKS